ncbi:glycosyltransferase family 59 protein [Botryobasidium botryosum FD-172 SS1]|uniref:Dol-P-Glc:Glc(2)Man(9)GlcNAc(2)-PP-Dol alpha-1,2-glucosyltransferase n=1 Tax=Botryobasidium botryosum (strain FD-172 SS1) TaxID=930990 RepID=A0A067MH92_BOTB1|nr:glycosyltransferase family 59 protein [Botryobasidium botryosum FD-172 SS1]
MLSFPQETTYYVAYVAFNIILARHVNDIVQEPYMDEPFHIPQAQAYCRGDWLVWDPKITTPPGLYILSVILKRVFIMKCSTPMLRMTNLLLLALLPPILSHLLALKRRTNPPETLLAPTMESIVISTFPIAWFFAFLYYTDLGSLVFVLLTIVTARKRMHWLAALLGFISCTFRQTNIIWVLFALASSAIARLHTPPSPATPSSDKGTGAALHNPPAHSSTFVDIFRAVQSLIPLVPSLIYDTIPYLVLTMAFAVFVYLNEGLVLGDKSNHTIALHIPQIYYFFAFSSLFGLPVLISGEGGVVGLANDVRKRMKALTSLLLTGLIMVSVYFYTIHHPFLLSDNRHYTFYVWNRIYRFHPLVPLLLSPLYLACFWAWHLRLRKQTLLEAILFLSSLVIVLLPAPLLEPRYFLIPYILLRAQVSEPSAVGLLAEGGWYALLNWVTMYVFLYKERAGVGRFMW